MAPRPGGKKDAGKPAAGASRPRRPRFSKVTSMQTQPGQTPDIPRSDPVTTQGAPPARAAPSKAPPPFSGDPLEDLLATGIFSSTGIGREDLDEIFEKDPKDRYVSPTPGSGPALADLERLAAATESDRVLLIEAQKLIRDAYGEKTTEQLKREIMAAGAAWMEAGLSYAGEKLPGLFLEDGARNPARGRLPRTGYRGPTVGSATAPSATVIGTAGKCSTPTAPTRPTGNKETGVRPSTVTPSTVTRGAPTAPTESPLSGPGTTTDPTTVPPPAPEIGGVTWQRRNDLFAPAVMAAAGAAPFPRARDDDSFPLPTLASAINYDTESWG